MDAPSMVQRSGDTLIVRSVVSGDTIFLDRNKRDDLKTEETIKYPNFSNEEKNQFDERCEESEEKNETLPQCKIKRNYSCNSCAFFTQNPRYFLTHLRDIHGEKIVINECNLCLYASRHYQKLVRHMKMVHGSTCGIEENANNRKRHIHKDGRKRKLGAPSKHSVVKNTAVVDSQENLRNQTKFEDSPVEDSLNNLSSKCRLCDFIASNRTQLADHEEEEHGGSKIFRCEKCTYVTHLKARFSKHVKYHSMPMIKCNTCDFRTPYKWNLDRHMKNHGGFGPFKCAACNFTADIKQSLTVHELNHHVPPVGNATGMNMSKRKNKVGATDIFEDVCSESGDLSDTYNNNNNEDFDDCYIKRQKIDSDDDQPTDLSQKSGCESTSIMAKKTNRPVPNLIPIQSASSSLCFAKNYSLRDIASLFFYDEKNFNAQHSHRLLDAADLSPSSTGSSSIGRRKVENFFDKLKETSVTCLGQNENLNCSCGHVSKCLSEAIIHAKSCTKAHKAEKVCTQSPVNLCANSNSIRCQFCRHRCKSSNDLAAHILKCSFVPHENYALSEKGVTLPLNGTSLKHPMENKVFVWNDFPNAENDEQEKNLVFVKEEENVTRPLKGLVVGNDSGKDITNLDNNENSYYGVETAPGYGEVTKKMTPEEEAANSSLKKVYKCPHCSFWASTASRFHVHIVGHLNKKPFECSLCNYRSNWRWDITKHIRLKTIRDPTHKNAKVLMNDETGRRNYTKYNKYITLMKVTEEDGDPKLMKSGAMTPNQEASLAFFNDFSSTISKSNPTDNTEKDSQSGNNNFRKEINLDQTQFSTYQMFTNAVLDATNKSMGISSEKSTGMNFPLPKVSDEFISHNVDTKPDGVEKKTTFKCKKCSFKNPNRDLVLLHVKEHYKEAETNQDKTVNAVVDTNLYVNNVLAAMCLPQQQTLSFSPPDKSSINITSTAGSLETFGKRMESSEVAKVSSDFTNSKTNTGGIIATFNDHGETDEASSGVVTTSGTGVNGWRGPAPFRCGHCHQVSNWKHVIQRHCRLKHNGNIRIESIDRSSSKNAPIYYTIVPQSVSNVNNVAESLSLNRKHVTNDVVASSIVTKNSLDKIYMENKNETHTSSDNNNNNADNKDLTMSYQNEPKTDSNNCKKNVNKINQTHASDESILENISSNEMQSCFRSSIKCPVNFENEEKSVCLQKNVNVCSPSEVSVASGSNEELFTNEEVLLPLTKSECKKSNGKETSSYSLSFCKYCPARFIAEKDLMLHLNTHNTNLPYRCNACSYTSRQESYLAAHSTVHTSDYNEKTEMLLKSLKVNPEFLRPGLTQISISETDAVFIVNEFALSLEDNIENSENETAASDKACKTVTMKQCPHCPFETDLIGKLKSHMKDHFCVSLIEKPNKCSYCDFSVMDDDVLKSHIKIHFKRFFHREQYVKCYTSYDFMKLIVAQKGNNHSDNNLSKEVLYDSNNDASHYIEDIPGTRKILVYFDKGELKTKHMDKNDEDECSKLPADID